MYHEPKAEWDEGHPHCFEAEYLSKNRVLGLDTVPANWLSQPDISIWLTKEDYSQR